MEHAKIEMEVIEKTVTAATDARLRELSELQLAFVGGGNAEATPG